jgi:hypothetical protein
MTRSFFLQATAPQRRLMETNEGVDEQVPVAAPEPAANRLFTAACPPRDVAVNGNARV